MKCLYKATYMKKCTYLEPVIEILVDLDEIVLCDSTGVITEDFNNETTIEW